MIRDPADGTVHDLPERPEPPAKAAIRRMRNKLAGRDFDDDGPEAA